MSIHVSSKLGEITPTALATQPDRDVQQAFSWFTQGLRRGLEERMQPV
jgi:hypothetical protein